MNFNLGLILLHNQQKFILEIINQKVMASKKFKLLLMGIFSLMSFGVFAQDTGVYNIYDSSVISSKGRAQQNEFMNNTYNFPAKPRNEMEFGISGGMFTISGDVSSKLPTPGFAVHLRKALGYVFSLRLQYLYGVAKGQNWTASQGYANNPPGPVMDTIQRQLRFITTTTLTCRIFLCKEFLHLITFVSTNKKPEWLFMVVSVEAYYL